MLPLKQTSRVHGDWLVGAEWNACDPSQATIHTSSAAVAGMPKKLARIVRCPRCVAPITAAKSGTNDCKWVCTNQECAYAISGFPVASGGTPALVDFENSVLSRQDMAREPMRMSKRREQWANAKRSLLTTLFCSQGPTRNNAKEFLSKVGELAGSPTVLVIGGATIGLGANSVYADTDITLISTDIYQTDITDLVADGHHLPFADGAIHGVWIQAVLEHVLEPHTVVSEIHRVLHEHGIVYAETPFMQQVHLGRYDFTRFTLSGHRWLFRCFEEISSGVTQGPGTTMLWSLRYFFSSLLGTYKLGTLIALAFFWLRFFDRCAHRAHAADAANGVYFLGRRSNQAVGPKEILNLYRGAMRTWERV